MKKMTVLVATILVVLAAMSTQGLCQEDGIDACYKKVNGQLRISDSCRPPEYHISLVSREEFEALVEQVEDLLARVEILEEGEEVDPCAGKDDCCTTDEQCPGDPSICVESTECKGVRWDGICVDNVCDTAPVNDDSGCDGIEIDCTPYASVYCTDEVDQTAPSCLTSCQSDDDCVESAICVESECVIQLFETPV